MFELTDLIHTILEKNKDKITNIITDNLLDELIDYIIFCKNQDDAIAPEDIRKMFIIHMEKRAGGMV